MYINKIAQCNIIHKIIILLISINTFATDMKSGLTNKEGMALYCVIEKGMETTGSYLTIKDKRKLTVIIDHNNIYGLSPQPKYTKEFHIVIFSDDLQKALLIIVYIENKRFVPDDTYLLTKQGMLWGASEGNGGIATYKAISKYVTHIINNKRKYKIPDVNVYFNNKCAFP